MYQKTLICSLGIVDFRNEGGNIGQNESTKKRRERYISDLISQCNDLSRTTKHVGRWLMRRAVTCWKRDDEDIAEWHEEVSDVFLNALIFMGR